MKKIDIIKELVLISGRADKIVDCFDELESKDSVVSRTAQQEITFIMFELLDNIGRVEVGLYNYLRKGGVK